MKKRNYVWKKVKKRVFERKEVYVEEEKFMLKRRSLC